MLTVGTRNIGRRAGGAGHPGAWSRLQFFVASADMHLLTLKTCLANRMTCLASYIRLQAVPILNDALSALDTIKEADIA